jgi:hypothetical protein
MLSEALSAGVLISSDGKLKTQRQHQKTQSDDPTVQFLHASEEWQRQSSRLSSTRWTADLVGMSVGLYDGLKKQDKGFGSKSLSTGWTDGPGSSSSNGYIHFIQRCSELKSFNTREPMHHRLKRRVICVNDLVRWKVTSISTKWTNAREKHNVGSSDSTI